MTRVNWNLTPRTWWSLFGLGVSLWAITVHTGEVFAICGVFFAALMIALSIRPLADILSRWRVPRGVTVLLVYLALAGVLFLLGLLIVPMVTQEIHTISQGGTDYFQRLYEKLTSVPGLRHAMPSNQEIFQQLGHRIESVTGKVLGTLWSFSHMVVDLIVVIVLAYFLTTNERMAETLLRNWVAPRQQKEVGIVMHRISHRLSRWVWAQSAIAVYFGATFGGALYLLGVPFALTIAVIGGVLEIIPYFGSGAALLLGALSALTVRPILAIWVVVAFLIIVEVKGHIIEPNFYGRVIGLHPAVVVAALLIGAETAGIIGVLFAVPVAAVVVTILQEIRDVRSEGDSAEGKDALI